MTRPAYALLLTLLVVTVFGITLVAARVGDIYHTQQESTQVVEIVLAENTRLAARVQSAEEALDKSALIAMHLFEENEELRARVEKAERKTHL